MSNSCTDSYNSALDALDRHDTQAALDAIENALVEDPKDAESWKLYILILNLLGRKSDADSATEKWLALGTSEASALILEGDSAMSNRQLEEAMVCYRRAIELEPDGVDARLKLATALAETGEFSEAIGHAAFAAQKLVDDAHAHYLYGRILRLAGRKTEALESLTQAVKFDPSFMPAVYEQGMVLADADQLEQALLNFERYRARYPGDPSATKAIERIQKLMTRTF